MKTRKEIKEMAGRYKGYGMDKQRAWSEYIKETGLNPGIDAREFYDIYESAPIIYNQATQNAMNNLPPEIRSLYGI